MVPLVKAGAQPYPMLDPLSVTGFKELLFTTHSSVSGREFLVNFSFHIEDIKLLLKRILFLNHVFLFRWNLDGSDLRLQSLVESVDFCSPCKLPFASFLSTKIKLFLYTV